MGVGQAGKVCVLSAALALGVGTARAQAQTIELKLSHFVPPNHAYHKWATAWAEQLGKDSGGRLKTTIYPNGQLVGPPNRQFDAARNAVVDIAFTLHGVTPGRYAMTELANLPFSWPKAGSGSATTSRRMSDLAPTYLEKEHQGLRVLYMAVANPVVFNCKSAIRTLDQFKGVKIRYAGVQNKYLIDALGAVPLLVPPPESQDALAKGIVECAMFPFEASLAYDLGSVAKFATVPGVSTATFAMVMNPAKYEFAAGRPQGADRQVDRAGGGGEFRQGLGGGRDARTRSAGRARRADPDAFGRRPGADEDPDGAAHRDGDRRARERRQAGAEVLRRIHEVDAPVCRGIGLGSWS